jgi:SNF2 family DNA or RNA helicase
MQLDLAPYQKQVRDFLVDHERAAAFVSVGLGKTASTLSAINTLFVDGEIRGALIVAPLRVATMTWPNELEKWDQFKWMRMESVRKRPPSGRSHIYTINYESLPKLKNLDFCDVVVLDEITKAKNHRSIRIKALKALFKHHRRWGLTGTPRPQGLQDLFGQIRVLDDGERLGKSFTNFRDTWFVQTDYMGYNFAPRQGAEEAVYKKIADMTITMRASDHIQLPDNIVEDIEVALPESAKRVYAELERELLVSMGKDGLVIAPQAATLVTKLLQICSGSVYNEERGVIQVHGAKIDALKALQKREGKENLLVASNFIHERERICREVPGAVDASKWKGDIEDAWNSGKIRMLVADPRSLGHGLNLQQGGCTTVWFSPNYSRELYDQFNGRTYRRGQTRATKIYRLLCPGTIDDAVAETLREKGEGQAQMLKLLSNIKRQSLNT